MVYKLDRVNRHFDHVIDVNVVMSVEKLRQKVIMAIYHFIDKTAEAYESKLDTNGENRPYNHFPNDEFRREGDINFSIDDPASDKFS